MTPDDPDAWDPFADPQGEHALKGLADQLRPDERRALLSAAAGEQLRDVEMDRLVWRGLAKRDKRGDLHLTEVGTQTLKELNE